MDARGSARSIYRESLPILLVSLCGGIFAGLVLGTPAMREGLETYPGLLLALPAFLATRGNVYGTLGARIASGLHQGVLDPEFAWDRRLVNAAVASVCNGVGISTFVAVCSWGILAVQPGRTPAPLLELLGILVLASALTSIVMVGGIVTIVFAGYRRGTDPDNLIGPVVTTLGDVFGVCFLAIAVGVAGVVA
ncbi:magnesium transporter [Salinarchaeum chitinilyticum]